MATLNLGNVTIPDSIIPTVLQMARDWCDAQNPRVPYGGLTNLQLFRTFLLGHLREQYLARAQADATLAAQLASVNAAVVQAAVDAGGIS